MNSPLLIDVTHTSHTRARTGIQRVTRGLCRALGADSTTICHDPHARTWRELSPIERHTLEAQTTVASHRGAQWPLGARLRGRIRRWLRATPAVSLAESSRVGGLLVPEVFSPQVAASLPALLAHVRGPRAAIFHDAIALKFPELTPAKTVTRFPAYLRELLMFDGIAAVSDDSRQSLLEYWDWLGIRNAPPVVTFPLGIDRPPANAIAAAHPDVLIVLCVSSLEGRKNHLALLDACEDLWASGRRFSLRLIGLAHPETGRPALDRVRGLQTAGRPLRYDGAVDDAILEAAYAECTFTVYPSLCEGFGLPVLESVARGKPCVCSARGALGEAAAPGGCLTLERTDRTSLFRAIDELLSTASRRETLSAAARRRQFKSWETYASELVSWLKTLQRRT